MSRAIFTPPDDFDGIPVNEQTTPERWMVAAARETVEAMRSGERPVTRTHASIMNTSQYSKQPVQPSCRNNLHRIHFPRI